MSSTINKKINNKTNSKNKNLNNFENENIDKIFNELNNKSIKNDETKSEQQTNTKSEQQNSPSDDPKNIDKLIADNIKSALKMWEDVKKIVKETPEYKEWEDKKKISYFRDDLNYKEFMNTYPITSRYMVCVGHFTVKAFKKFLNKLYTIKLDPIKRLEKGYTEDQWLRRQADYVRYLWEDYQKGHYNINHAQEIWQDAYKKLRGEMDDFRDKHKEIEKNISDEKKTHKIENIKELLYRIKNSNQKLSDEDNIKLLEALKKAKEYKEEPKAQESIDPKTGIKTIIKSQPIYYDPTTGEYSQPVFEDNASKSNSNITNTTDNINTNTDNTNNTNNTDNTTDNTNDNTDNTNTNNTNNNTDNTNTNNTDNTNNNTNNNTDNTNNNTNNDNSDSSFSDSSDEIWGINYPLD
jgi:hypothetical protein